MAYSVHQRDGVHEVELRGTFTTPDKAVVRELTDSIAENNGNRCVLAMEGLEILDSYGLEMLVLMNDVTRAKGVALTIRNPPGQIRHLLDLTGLDKLIPIES